LKQVDALKEEVAERKRTEEAVRRSEAKLQDFVANATIGIHFVAGDGPIIWANQTQLDLLGNTLDGYIDTRSPSFPDRKQRRTFQLSSDLRMTQNIPSRSKDWFLS